ncbi:hypothetical protein GLYMA_11G118150v4 [Glycine max]|nr:hypothetical protein GLYMA_11G118150v4 [Glycine max]KAH1158723.1 hypothetical protein GYH30_030775 [Glycine max]
MGLGPYLPECHLLSLSLSLSFTASVCVLDPLTYAHQRLCWVIRRLHYYVISN